MLLKRVHQEHRLAPHRPIGRQIRRIQSRPRTMNKSAFLLATQGICHTLYFILGASFLRSITNPYSIQPQYSLTLLSSLLTLSWFLTAHILEYTSINTCRHSSPHIWWLTFGILCLMYLSVLEVILLSFVVFVVAPILFVGSFVRGRSILF